MASLGLRSLPGLTSSTSASDVDPRPPETANFARSIEADVVSLGDPHQIMERLVRFAAENVDVDRCTLTSLDQDVLRVEASYQRGGPPDFIGHEYPLTWLPRQPLLYQAVTTGAIVLGGSLAESGTSDPNITPALKAMRHTAIVPLSVGETVGAVLILSRRTDRPFVAHELDGLQQVGLLAVLALRNARLVDEVRSAQRRGLDSLTQMSRHVASSLDPATFFEKMGETVAGLVSAKRAGFWQLTGTELVPLHQGSAFATEQSGAQPHGGLDSSGDEDLARVLVSGQALRLGDGEPMEVKRPDSVLARLGARDVLAVPWRTAAVPLGVLAAWNSQSRFSDQDEWIMRLAARASALVWQGYAAEQRAQGLQAAELDRLEAHAQRMAELERQKSEFLQLASHELRAPITLVSGYLSMLEEGSLGELPEAIAKVVPLMTARMRHMSELVDRMLTTSRMEVRSRGQHEKDIGLDSLARAVAASARVPAGGRSKRTINVESTGRIRVRADPEQVTTILGNLVSNALKYSPDGADVTIAVRDEPGWVAVDVTDHGDGIAEEDLPKLFQPFGRLQSAIAAGIQGTGLGLHLSRALAQAEGGDIEVKSQPGEGSTFTLRLPRGRRRPAGRVHA
ncbi:MAG: GAF domain-containing sensor histidine kinase [Candidatus Dormiibacterota bacterium]